MSDERTVFIVDDDHAAAGSMAALMMSVGLKVETHHSAAEFLAAHDGSRKGCLVFDMRMPGMDGLQLLEALAAKNVRIPSICTSGFLDFASKEKLMQSGALACFEKPFDSVTICDAVQSALARD